MFCICKKLFLFYIYFTGDIRIHIPGPSDPNVDASHPLTKLAVEAPESACGLPLFELLCKLLYIQYARYLVS